jgi:hypothetical protein
MEAAMTIEIDDKGIRIVITWKVLREAFKALYLTLKALLPIIAAILALLAGPEIRRLGEMLGWW